ncbi:MAG: hypothetical protein IKB53_01320, partial [Oscillospiraceae bacterium]|nr:hypothetical protein [Oscillospiraceae bacterium]
MMQNAASHPSGWLFFLVWYLSEANRTIQMQQSGGLLLDAGSTASTPFQIDSPQLHLDLTPPFRVEFYFDMVFMLRR